ncbi:MAG TPA: methyltransferase domain-containing protein [Longimicrobiales bacterium]|nr:methyltransferase domain-containing protein [Longimicrobiales bacterium]
MATSKHWQLAREAAERYERILVPVILGPAARALVEWAGLRNGESVVDVGCGTGAATRLTAEAVGSSGRVAGVDVNPGMLDVARSAAGVRGAVIEWFEASAYQLPFADGEFNVALCAQTLQFLDDRPQAAAEMYRVLEPGGRVAISFWCDIRENPYFHALVDAVTDNIGAETAAGLGAAFGLSDPETIRALLIESGFENVNVSAKQLDLEVPRLDDFVPRHVSATPMSAGFDAASVEARRAVVQDVSERLAAYQTGEGVRVPFRTHLVTGIR